MNEKSLRLFNQNQLDIYDPVEFTGVRQPGFSIANTYQVDKERAPAICSELYSHIQNKLKSGAIGTIAFKVDDYIDYQHQTKEEARRYITIERETNRGIKMNIFIRFLPFGDNVYVAIDSYVLGTMDIWGVAWRVFFTVVPLLFALFYFSIVASLSTSFGSRSSSPGFGSVSCCFAPVAALMVLIWFNTFRAFKQHGNIKLAMRQNFSSTPNNQSFDMDDSLIFFKSVIPLVIFSVREVLEKNHLPLQTLDDFITEVNNIVNISSGGGLLSIVGSTIGGQGNRITQ